MSNIHKRAKHERTVVRLYMDETSIVPGVQTFLGNATIEECYGVLGGLEIAKKMVLDNIKTADLEDDEVDDILDLLDGSTDYEN